MKAFYTLTGFFLVYLLVHLLVAVGTASAHTPKHNWTSAKANEYEHLDRLDGYNDNCVVIKKYAHCLGR